MTRLMRLKWLIGRNTGLLKPSVIKPVLTTIEKNLILRRLGNLEDEDKENLRLILQTILG